MSLNSPATDWEKPLVLLPKPMTSAALEGVHSISISGVPVSVEGILQDGKASERVSVQKFGPPQSRRGVGVRCKRNVVSGLLFIGF